MSRSVDSPPRVGQVLFLLYLLLYVSFVVLAAFSPATMDRPIAGINLAVWYGFLLIVAAVALAVLYGVLAPSGDGDATTTLPTPTTVSDGEAQP